MESWRQTMLKLIEENTLKDKKIKELENKSLQLRKEKSQLEAELKKLESK